MRKQSITTNLTILIFAAACLFAPARAGVQSDKESEIRRMLRLTGMQKLMDQMKSQMLTGLRNSFARRLLASSILRATSIDKLTSLLLLMAERCHPGDGLSKLTQYCLIICHVVLLQV